MLDPAPAVTVHTTMGTTPPPSPCVIVAVPLPLVVPVPAMTPLAIELLIVTAPP